MKQSKLWIVYDGRAIPRKELAKNPEFVKLQKEVFATRTQSKADKYMNFFFPSNTDDAMILVACNSLEEARSYSEDFGDGNCIYEYDINNKRELVNERFVEVLT